MEHLRCLIRCTYIRALSNIMMIQISIMHTAVALDASTDSTDGMILTSAFIGEARTGGGIIIIGTIHGSTDIIHRCTVMGGTHSPYYYGWNGWYGWRPSYYYSYSRPTGTTNHSTGAWHSSGRRNSGFSGYRGSLSSTSGSFGNRNNSTSRPNSNTNNRYTFGGQRRTTNTNTVSRPASRPQTSSPSINRGSFGGSRGGGSFGGGSFGGGGRSGGGSFGGRG